MKELYAAMAEAINSMGDPIKNAQNSHFKNKYADLTQVRDCLEVPLQENGLMVVQFLDPGAMGIGGTETDNILVTRLVHLETGQHLDSRIILRCPDNKPQSLGSAITYMRRYALKAMFGMVDVDDDGNAASGRSAERSAPAPKAPAESMVLPDVKSLEDLMQRMSRAASMNELESWARQAVKLRLDDKSKRKARAAYDKRVEELGVR